MKHRISNLKNFRSNYWVGLLAPLPPVPAALSSVAEQQQAYVKASNTNHAVALTTILALSLAATSLQADRILVIGDSWAWPVAPELETVLHENDHPDMSVDATPFKYLAKEMADPTGLSEITAWLEERPDVTVVQISAGGNDWEESGWIPAWAGTQTETNIIATIIRNIEIVADHIFSLRPGVRILWSSYDFPRPVQKGTPLEINTFMITMARQIADFAMTKPGLDYVDLNGTLQLTYGFDGNRPSPFDPPYAIPAGDPSLPDPSFPSPFEPFLPNDRWHLESHGYKALAQAQYEGFYASLLNGSDFQINAGLNDAWFNPATNGQGFLITVYPDIRQIFLAWFTFDTERPPNDAIALLGDPGHRWLTAQGPYDGDTANLTLFMTEGGVFDAATPVASTDPAGEGSLRLEFADCSEGLVTYTITSLGISGEIPIQRVSLDNIPLCESLEGR